MEGPAYELQPGDVLHAVGGTANGRRFKRYRMDDKVVDIWRTPRARTRIHLQLARQGTLILRWDYPVRFTRLTAEQQADAATEEAKRQQGLDEARARGYARRAARRQGK